MIIVSNARLELQDCDNCREKADISIEFMFADKQVYLCESCYCVLQDTVAEDEWEDDEDE